MTAERKQSANFVKGTLLLISALKIVTEQNSLSIFDLSLRTFQTDVKDRVKIRPGNKQKLPPSYHRLLDSVF